MILELVGAPNLADNLAALEQRGPDRRDRDRGRRQGRAEPRAADGQAGADPAASTLRARPLEEKAATARAMERSVLPLLAAGDGHGADRRDLSRSSEAEAAYDSFTAGGKLGKIVLEM